MLILTRKPGESIYIGDDIIITVSEIKGNQVRIGIKAPPQKRIYREEIYQQILEENKQAAAVSLTPENGLDKLGDAFKSQGPGSGGSKLNKQLGVASFAITAKTKSEPEIVQKKKKVKPEDE